MVRPRWQSPALVSFAALGLAGLVCLAAPRWQPVANDSPAQRMAGDVELAVRKELATSAPPRKTRFHGLVDYRELSMGSITGMVLGVVIGKLLHVLVVVLMVAYFAWQYLAQQGMVRAPLVGRVVNIGKKHVNVDELVQNPSFKVSFVAAFAVAAFNV